MKSHRLLWALLVLTAVASPVTAADLVKLHSEDKTLRGRVTEMSKTQIVFEMKPVDKTIMVNESGQVTALLSRVVVVVEVIQNDHVRPQAQETLGQMGPDKPGAAK